MDVSRWSSIFSRILDRIGRRLIGRYDAMSSGFFPVFAIIMICPTFHWQGKYSIRSKVLYICYRSGAFLGRSLKDFSGDQVYPGAFWDGFFVTFLTSLIRIFFIGRVVWCGAFSSFLMVSSSIADSWDGTCWKTYARCSAKAVDFCLFVPRCCGLCVLAVFGVEVALFCGRLSITNSPWLQLASVLGDSFGYPRFWEYVKGVLVLSLFCCNVVCLEGLLLVAILCELFVFFASFCFIVIGDSSA